MVTARFLPPVTRPPGMKAFCLVWRTRRAAACDATSMYWGQTKNKIFTHHKVLRPAIAAVDADVNGLGVADR
jgi:hypothetical protein